MDIVERITDNDIVIQRLLGNHDADALEVEELRARQRAKTLVVCKENTLIPSVVCTAGCCIETYKVRGNVLNIFR